MNNKNPIHFLAMQAAVVWFVSICQRFLPPQQCNWGQWNLVSGENRCEMNSRMLRLCPHLRFSEVLELCSLIAVSLVGNATKPSRALKAKWRVAMSSFWGQSFQNGNTILVFSIYLIILYYIIVCFNGMTLSLCLFARVVFTVRFLRKVVYILICTISIALDKGIMPVLFSSEINNSLWLKLYIQLPQWQLNWPFIMVRVRVSVS